MKLIINCGTTNLRVYLTDETGNVLAEKHSPDGVRHTAIDGHNGRLKAGLKRLIGELLSENGQTAADVSDCIAYGMITSNLGLTEIPHLIAPAGKAALREGMRTLSFPEIAPFPIRFIPGVRNSDAAVTPENYGGMDMMRGEETEAVGLYALLHCEGPVVFILPGSHQKFVKMNEEGEITGCRTSVSGELLEALTMHTVLADAVGRAYVTAESFCPDMVRTGAVSAEKDGLGRAAFSGRILSTLGNRSEAEIRNYLLGAVLSEDVKAMRAFFEDGEVPDVCIAGNPVMNRAFSEVLDALGGGRAVSVPEALTARMGISGVKEIIDSVL